MGQSNPNIIITTSSAFQVLGLGDRRVLIVGQMLTGTATAGIITDNIGNNGEESALFGAKSQVSAMVRAFKNENKNTTLDVLALQDGAGTKAVKTIAWTGTATASGTYYLYVNSHKYTLSVALGDTATIIAGAFETLINADTIAQWTSVDTTGSLAITSTHFGTVGTSNMSIKLVGTVPGLTFTITETTPGATDPTLPSLSTVIGNRRYTAIIFPVQYGTTDFTTFLEDRFAIKNAVLSGTGITAKVDTKANHISTLTALNKKTLDYMTVKKLSDANWVGSDVMIAEYELSSRYGALHELRLTDGADLTGKVIAGDRPLDLIGGISLSSKPLHNTPFNIDVLDDIKTWNRDDIDDLKEVNAIVVHNNDAGNAVILDEVFTTYKTDSAGNIDQTYKCQEFINTISSSTEVFYRNAKKIWAQVRLVNGSAMQGQVDVAKIIGEICKCYDILASTEYQLLDPHEKTNFKNKLVVVISKAKGEARISGILPIVSYLGTIIMAFEITL